MIIDTKSFGEIEIDRDKIILFREGIPAFEDEKQFAIINPREQENPFAWLQSVNNPELAFVIINPFLVYPDYEIKIPETAQRKLEIEDERNVMVFSLVVLAEELEKSTANLIGPLLINIDKKLGKQVILDDERYTTKHYIFQQKVKDRGV